MKAKSYRMLERIALGGMGEIVRAEMHGQDDSVQMVALKLIHKRLAEQESFAAMFVDEAQVTMRLAHPNVVRAFDAGRIDDRLFLAIEYVPGTDLATVLADARDRLGQPLPHSHALYVAIELLKGLEHAHGLCAADGKHLRIVHRDVSPGNVLISEDGGVKLTDFGIAKSALRSRKTTAGHVRGKLPYMAPEQLRESGVDARTDIYGTGAVLFEMVTGQQLIKTRNNDSGIIDIIHGRLRRPRSVRKEIPEELEKLVMRALCTSPDDRYPSAAAMRAELEAYAAKENYPLSGAEFARFFESAAARPPMEYTPTHFRENDEYKVSDPPDPEANAFNALLGKELMRLSTEMPYSVFTSDIPLPVANKGPAPAAPAELLTSSPPAGLRPRRFNAAFALMFLIAVVLAVVLVGRALG